MKLMGNSCAAGFSRFVPQTDSPFRATATLPPCNKHPSSKIITPLRDEDARLADLLDGVGHLLVLSQVLGQGLAGLL